MLYNALLELSKQLEIKLQVSDIRDVSRQPSMKKSTNSTLTVEFTNTLTKATFLSAIKDHKQRNGTTINGILSTIQTQLTWVYQLEKLPKR